MIVTETAAVWAVMYLLVGATLAVVSTLLRTSYPPRWGFRPPASYTPLAIFATWPLLFPHLVYRVVDMERHPDRHLNAIWGQVLGIARGTHTGPLTLAR